jgi:ribosomal protein S18 acetylase RimI-like enzyme
VSQLESAQEPALVRRAEPRDVAALVGVLARAFDADPFYNWLLPQGPRRAQSFAAIFELILARMSDDLRETFTTSDASGAALWLKPGMQKLSLWSRARLLPSFARIVGWGNIPRGLRIMDHMDALHARFAPGPHFYLSVLGVDPTQQGRGLGAQLLKPMLERCDRERHLIYLETSREKNVPFYERHGFKLAAKTPYRDFPTFWSMTRDAQPES